jgi:hypothetical protein
MPNVFDTNDIRTTGFTVEGIAVISGNSSNAILTVTGESGTNLQVIDDANSTLVWSISGETGALFDVLTDRINAYVPINTTGNTVQTGSITITGSLTAESKSFDIPHPTKQDYRLRYGSLEGPEYGVYHRGKTTSSVIHLPEYWNNLIDESTITVHLTPHGKNSDHWVEKIENNQVEINSENGEISCFFIVYAERKDIPGLLVEYKPL